MFLEVVEFFLWIFPVFALSIALFALIRVKLTWKRTVLQEVAEILDKVKAQPKEWADYFSPVIDALIDQYKVRLPQMMAQGTGKPLKITGNRSIDGLIQMYLQSKMGSMGQEAAQTAKSVASEVVENPFR